MIGSGEGSGDVVVGEGGPAVVIEELEWRERALQAERMVEDLQQRVDELVAEAELGEASRQAERESHELESLLIEAGAIDLATAGLLATGLIGGEELSPAEAVARLRREKEFLFARAGAGPSAMSGTSAGGGAIHDAMSLARASGDRRELLHYLRLRRGA